MHYLLALVGVILMATSVLNLKENIMAWHTELNDPIETAVAEAVDVGNDTVANEGNEYRQGDKDAGPNGDIRALQTTLSRLGLDVGEIDGVYGRRTMNTVQDGQEMLGLPRTGVADQATQDRLNNLTDDQIAFFTSETEAMADDAVVKETPAPVETTPIDPNTITSRLFNDLKTDFGLSDVQAAALVGNLVVETGNFKTLQEVNPTVKGSRGGYGIAQWTGPRRVAYESWAKQNKLPIDSYEANYGFLKEELTNKQAGTIESIGINTISRLKGIETLDDASFLVQDYFLRPGIPHQDKREAATKTIYEQMTSK